MVLSLRQFIKKNAFRKEIILIIVLKCVALMVIWGLFFQHPLSKQLSTQDLVRHYG
jgi:hypothetical protein